jgi:hypothetical protein
LGSRALFAFQASETEELSDGSRIPTSDAQLGALMQWEFQSAMLNWMKLFEEFCKAWAKTKSGRPRRR